jgi:DNA-binding transcriptional MerR regulator
MIEEKDSPPSGVLSPTTGLEEPVQAEISANFLAEYEPCITCKDLGKNCKGPKLAALGTIANVREYHRRLRSSHKITMKQIFQLTENEISNATVKDYFSHEAKDFRWATVSLIDNALTVICGDCVGLPPAYLPNCPATSSEIKEKIASVEDKLKASESECELIRSQIVEIEGRHIDQMAEYRQDQQKRIDWLKNDVKMWRKVSFCLMGLLVAVIAAFVVFHII